MKPSRLKEHLTKVHPERSRESVAYFRKLRDKIMNRRTLCSVISPEACVEHDSLLASYKISLMIASFAKPHTIGEQLLVPVVNDVLPAIFHNSEADIGRKISLSKDTVQRRIDEMAMDVEEALCDLLRRIEFSLQLDESTLPGNEALLLAYVRFIKDEQLTQEFLFSRELSTDAKGEGVALLDMLELRQAHIAYLADLYEKFNAMNLQLQLAEPKRCPNPCGQDVVVYCKHLEMLHEELKRRFHDVLSTVVPNWVIDPFASDEDAELHLQEELSNDELRPRLRQGYATFWLQKQIPILYPRLWYVVKRLLIAFPSSSLVERCFSVVTDLLMKKRNRLQVVSRVDLRLRMTGIEPDIEKLARLNGRHDAS
ncbi:hypothetical protein M514_18052 [Trichuris suis]|uniref:HAT C-terminal dimerisation domain-containing protein n=1 Tax=Trichuris suis TaxID=68888 RepID=A0A085NJM1_9BILA|nr:hypothetical protein M514_18052 [Trichuris suis]